MEIKRIYRRIVSQRNREAISAFFRKCKKTNLYSYIYSIKTIPEISTVQGEKNAYLIGSTSHSNLGDHAISYAELVYLNRFFSDYSVIEILDKDVYKYIHAIKKLILKDDIIFLHGGGNVGTEYFEHEIIRRKVVESFPNNRIVIFPQTVDFRDDVDNELSMSMSIYNNHDRLLFMVREQYSYKKLSSFLNERACILVPDIVLMLEKIPIISKKDRVLICLRKDAEKITPNNINEKIVSLLNSRGEKIEFIDTLHNVEFGKEKREDILIQFWKRLSTAKLVVTDRLHAMVFCHLLGIRCIVLPNYNYKVKGTYEWIKSDPNIVYFEDYKKALEYIEEYDMNQETTYNPCCLSSYYKSSVELIEEL